MKMSSTNKTANLGLNQWEASDAVQMADFNADNAKLDDIVGKLKASRLETVLIKDIRENSGVTDINVDLSGVNFNDYLMILIACPKTAASNVYANEVVSDNSTWMFAIADKSYHIGFPLKNSTMYAKFISVSDSNVETQRFYIEYSKLRNLLIRGVGSHTDTRIQIWGLK